MPKLSPILLFLVFFFPMGSGYLTLKYSEYKIHKSIKRQLKNGAKEKDLVLLYISQNTEKEELEFERIHNKEFKYKGEYYDIVRAEKRGETTLYWCIWDKEETALFAQLDHLFKHALAGNSNHQQKKELVRKSFDCYLDQSTCFLIPKFYCSNAKTIGNIANYFNRIIPIYSPPPELL